MEKTAAHKKSVQEKTDVVNKILDMYPQLKKEQLMIMNKVVGRKTSNKQPEPTEIVLQKFKYKDKFFYKDAFGGILDENAKLIGTYKEEVGQEICCFFDDKISDAVINFDINIPIKKNLPLL